MDQKPYKTKACIYLTTVIIFHRYLLKYDPCNGRGIQLKGSSARKVYINKEADYESVLERVREDLFGPVDRQGTTPDFTVNNTTTFFVSFKGLEYYLSDTSGLYRKMGRLSFRRGMTVQRHIDGHLPGNVRNMLSISG